MVEGFHDLALVPYFARHRAPYARISQYEILQSILQYRVKDLIMEVRLAVFFSHRSSLAPKLLQLGPSVFWHFFINQIGPFD